MKKFMAALMISAMLTVSPGCAVFESDQVQQVSSLVLGAPVLIADIDKVSKELTELEKENGIFSEDELEVFDDALMTYDMIKMEYEALGGLEIIPSVTDIEVMWKGARVAYVESMSIVNKHRDEYTSRTIISIDVMDAHAIQADKDITKLLADPTVANIGKALKILEGVVSIGLKVAAVL